MKIDIKKNNEIEVRAGGGYALLFAVLVSAVVLSVGVSILNIARKEILLTSGAQQSQYAFYAADTGYECAIYQDLQKTAFASTNPSSPGSAVSCGVTYTGSTAGVYASSLTLTQAAAGVNTSEYDFTFNVPVSTTACAAVTVQKFYTSVDTGTQDGNGVEIFTTTASTTITSDGFNLGWEATQADCNAPNPSKVERALVASY